MTESWVLGTRGSALALAQSRWVAARLEAATGRPVHLEIISTRGDRIVDRPLAEVGGKGLFTMELEAALRTGAIHLAVHSLKDLPTEDPAGLVLAAIPERADPMDVLVGSDLDGLPMGAVVGTGSLRRRLQLLALRSDLDVRDIRGNVGTRLEKRDRGDYDAIVLAAAGMARLGISRDDVHPFSLHDMVPAPGQGALGIQCAIGTEAAAAVAGLADPVASRAVTAERVFLATAGGGCNVPLGCHCWLSGPIVQGVAVRAGDDGELERVEGAARDPEVLGRELAAALAN